MMRKCISVEGGGCIMELHWPSGITEGQTTLAVDCLVLACTTDPIHPGTNTFRSSFTKLASLRFGTDPNAIKVVLFDLANKDLAITWALGKGVHAYDKEAIRHIFVPEAANGTDWNVGMIRRHYQVARFYRKSMDRRASLDEIDKAFEKYTRECGRPLNRAPKPAKRDTTATKTVADRLDDIEAALREIAASQKDLEKLARRALRLRSVDALGYASEPTWQETKELFNLD
jgi:hypothetical protein